MNAKGAKGKGTKGKRTADEGTGGRETADGAAGSGRSSTGRGGRGRAPTADRRQARLRRVEEVSAGGLVVRDRDGQVLGVLIAKHDRRGRLVWSLPKGHVEEGETLEQTAEREVREETGVTGEVIGPIGSVSYWFVFAGRKIHKTVHHFLLRRVTGELSDRDVEVVEVAWVPLSEIPDRLAYPDERRLMGKVRVLLAESA
jgi:ADP-ribose pyrophosphatase YjhB (NUDIX family)